MSIRRLKIAGREIQVKSTDDQTHLTYIVEQLNQRITTTQSVIPDSTEAILFVALELMDELVSAQKRLNPIQGGTQHKIESLLKALEGF